MSSKVEINTDKAPSAIGPYSQAIQVENILYISGQIPIDPITGDLDNSTFESQVIRVFENLKAICGGCNVSINNIVKINLYLTDLNQFNIVNGIMANYFQKPYPARTTVEVSKLPKGANFEADAIVKLT
tara:strand:- start:10937 stop:11323 length:387 start_codon:yes stop_codon:yes gene_type:complete